VNTYHLQAGRSDFAMLTHAPMGLLVLTGLMRAQAADSATATLAIDLLGIALCGLLCWIGGEVVASAARRRERRRVARPLPRRGYAH
jgi:TRAP-type C4-dicarboxylate transport system permease small subunit